MQIIESNNLNKYYLMTQWQIIKRIFNSYQICVNITFHSSIFHIAYFIFSYTLKRYFIIIFIVSLSRVSLNIITFKFDFISNVNQEIINKHCRFSWILPTECS